jgi:hypothetical protein
MVERRTEAVQEGDGAQPRAGGCERVGGPGDACGLVMLRPLAGMAEEVTGIVGLLRRGGRVVPRPDVTPAAERCRHHRPRPRRELC